jgi:hypothetical protein
MVAVADDLSLGGGSEMAVSFTYFTGFRVNSGEYKLMGSLDAEHDGHHPQHRQRRHLRHLSPPLDHLLLGRRGPLPPGLLGLGIRRHNLRGLRSVAARRQLPSGGFLSLLEDTRQSLRGPPLGEAMSLWWQRPCDTHLVGVALASKSVNRSTAVGKLGPRTFLRLRRETPVSRKKSLAYSTGSPPGITGGYFLLYEVWIRFRPYLGDLLVDSLISASLWVSLYGFKWLTHVLKIDGWAGDWITNIHSVSMILAFGLFGVLFALDVWKRRK